MTVQEATRPHIAPEEFDQWLETLRRRTLRFVLAGIFCMTLLLLSSITQRNNVIEIAISTAILFLVLVAVSILRHRHYTLAVWSLVLVSMFVISFIATWPGLSPMICLLALLTGLVTLLTTRRAGAILAILCTVWLTFAPEAYLPASFYLRLTTILLLWGTFGLLWLTLNPLLIAVQWAWSSYEQSHTRLEEARAMQVRLHETLEDLTAANQQLTRLNKLAQGLRQLAENERRAKEEFVAKVSHELRTPLNMIVGFCEVITQSPETYGNQLSQTLLADLDVVLRNSQHLSGLIDDVLDLSQIEAGQMALTKERASLAEIIDSAVVAVRPLYESKSLYLKTEVPEDLPLVFCDRMRIREVTLNLLSNAGRFTEVGGVQVRTWRDADNVYVSVTDTGPGIADADRERLFQPFQQLDNTIRRRYGGTGLGLSISKSFVELHNGELWVESTPGEGTAFFFRLPIDPPAPLSRDQATRWFNPYEPYEERGRPFRLPNITVRPRVIVVESNDAMQRLFQRYWDNVEVVPVSNWARACEETAHTPAQAILVNALDVGATLRTVQQSDAPPYGIPALVCSIAGATQANDALGVNDYLVKPVSRERLLAALDDLGQSIETVLIVDDEPDAQRLFWRMLSSAKRGYRLLRAYDGRQALALLQGEKPDVILLDLMMPEMDGFQFLAALAEIPERCDIPVILISARDPLGQPVASNALAVTRQDGLSVAELLEATQSLIQILGVRDVA